MAATSTLKQVLEQIVRDTGVGFNLPSLTGATTTLTLANSYLTGPFTGSKFPIGSPIIITSTVGAGDKTFVSGYAPATGVITVSPAITALATSAVLFYGDQIDHPDHVTDAIDRAFNNRLTRWQLTPLTFVPDGDLRGTTVTDYWTSISGVTTIASYVTPTWPEGSAAATTDSVGYQRVLQAALGATSATGDGLKSNVINLALNAQTTAYQRYFQTAIRLVSSSGVTTPTVQIRAYDETNAAYITTNVIYGNNQTHVTASTGFINMSGTINVPATCKAISYRLTGAGTFAGGATLTAQMLPLIEYPVDAQSFPIPNRIINDEYIGNFHYGSPVSGTSGPYSMDFSEPITTGGLTHTIQNFGDHYNVTFNFRPIRPVYFDELTYDTALGTTMASTTTFPLDYVTKWAKFELLNYLMNKEQPKYIQYASRAIPTPNAWMARRNAALKSVQGSEYEPEMMHIYGRVT